MYVHTYHTFGYADQRSLCSGFNLVTAIHPASQSTIVTAVGYSGNRVLTMKGLVALLGLVTASLLPGKGG